MTRLRLSLASSSLSELITPNSEPEPIKIAHEFTDGSNDGAQSVRESCGGENTRAKSERETEIHTHTLHVIGLEERTQMALSGTNIQS